MISLMLFLIGIVVFVISCVCRFVWWLLGLCAFFVVAGVLVTIGITSAVVLVPVSLIASLVIGGFFKLLFGGH